MKDTEYKVVVQARAVVKAFFEHKDGSDPDFFYDLVVDLSNKIGELDRSDPDPVVEETQVEETRRGLERRVVAAALMEQGSYSLLQEARKANVLAEGQRETESTYKEVLERMKTHRNAAERLHRVVLDYRSWTTSLARSP